jgi:hypothetical protein
VIRPALLALACGWVTAAPVPAPPARAGGFAGPVVGTWSLTRAFPTTFSGGNVAVVVTVGRGCT